MPPHPRTTSPAAKFLVSRSRSAIRSKGCPQPTPQDGRRPYPKSPPGGRKATDSISFFTGDKVLDNIRLDAPYSGSVHGIKLGDSFDNVRAKLGEPLRSWDFGGDKANLYQFGSTSVRFDVNSSGKVGTIFVMSN